jgi:hypothetical protein
MMVMGEMMMQLMKVIQVHDMTIHLMSDDADEGDDNPPDSPSMQ